MIIPDVNLLLYAHGEGEVRYAPARQWWRELLEGTEEVGLPWAVVMGFLRISTSRRASANQIPPDRAVVIVNDWFSHDHVRTLTPGPRHMILLSRLLEAVGTGGNLVPDAHIAALAIEYEAEVHTNDGDFARFPGLRWRNPLRTDA